MIIRAAVSPGGPSCSAPCHLQPLTSNLWLRMANPLLAADNRILPALVTPLTPTGQLDVASSERLIEHLYQKGVGGLYLPGSTGEGIYLDFDIRKQIIEIAVRLSKGRGNVIVHVGAIQAAKAFELAAHAGQ